MALSNIVSVAVDVDTCVQLFKFNKDEPLDEIIKLLCKESNISYRDNKFSFQFIRDQSNNKLGARYVTEDNRVNIVDGTELKLVYSPQELMTVIYENLQEKGDLCWALEKLAGHIDDPVFVLEVFSPCYPFIIVLTNGDKLPPKLYNFCLKIILGFFKFNCIPELDQDLVKQLLKNVSSDKCIEHAIIENSLRLLELCISKNQYSLIVDKIDLDDLIPHLWDRESPVVQECALALINNIVRFCRCDETKSQLLKIMNSAKFRFTISSNVLYPGSEPNNDLAQQLYMYQTLILNLLSDLFDPVLMDYNTLPDSGLVSENKRYSNFESEGTESTESSTRNSNEFSHQVDRISYSWKNDGMHSKRDHLVLSFLNLEIAELNKEIKHLEEMPNIKSVNQLTYNCVIYFSKRYRQNYQCCLVTEGCRNFITISYDLVNLISHNVLHIGETPVPGSTAYLPLVFSATAKQPFLEELFCVAMWLFERTKREMNAKTYDDYIKMLKVMERKLIEGLMAQPKTFNELEVILRGFTYSAISEQWHVEWKAKQDHFLTKSSAVKELRIALKCDMTEIIKNQRISYISNGSKFPVWNSQRHQKVKNKYWFAHLSSNKKFILYSTNISIENDDLKDMKSLCLRDVEEFVTGKKCPHLKDFKWGVEKQENPLCFSLIYDKNEHKSLDFVASSREVFDYWVDALNILLGNKMKSNKYHEELNVLLDMELKTRLLDLEGLDCPYEPPPVPPLPDNYEFNF